MTPARELELIGPYAQYLILSSFPWVVGAAVLLFAWDVWDRRRPRR